MSGLIFEVLIWLDMCGEASADASPAHHVTLCCNDACQQAIYA